MRKTNVFGHCELWASALLLVTSACTGVSSLPGGGDGLATAGSGNVGSGSVGSGTGGGTGSAPTSGAGAGSTSTTPTTSGTLNNVPAGPLDSGRLTLRRLNDREYDDTMRDLLGTTQTLAANGFPGDSADDGFDTVGTALSFSDLLFKQEFAAASTLVTELVSRPATDPLHAAVFVCTPTAATFATCLPQILTSFMPKAWRRPVTPAEVAAAVAVGTAVLSNATSGADPVTTGLSGALQYVLTSPNFLYHIELGSPAIVPSSSAVTPLSDYEVASRLSYFLWSSMPDATLTKAAAAGQLANGTGIPAQLTRMIADPKFSGFISGFADQWLGANNVGSVQPPDPTMFPNADQPLLDSIASETEAFFGNLVTSQAPLAELLTANYTFANGRLAQFYGVQGVPATQTAFTKLSLAGTQRLGGILTQETFLTTTSLPTRTSPVKRGEYVLAQMVCTPPQPPPPNVPQLVVPALGSGLTVRQALNQHASNPACATCHNAMDPIGYTFENFDASGAYRTTDNGATIDASGSLYGINGAPVNGAQGIAQAIAADPRFTQCIVKQALTYGIGRTFDAIDGLGYVETVAQPLLKSGTWVSALQAVVTSQAFLTTRGGQ